VIYPSSQVLFLRYDTLVAKMVHLQRTLPLPDQVGCVADAPKMVYSVRKYTPSRCASVGSWALGRALLTRDALVAKMVRLQHIPPMPDQAGCVAESPKIVPQRRIGRKKVLSSAIPGGRSKTVKSPNLGARASRASSRNFSWMGGLLSSLT
jgi:hypothetical protein